MEAIHSYNDDRRNLLSIDGGGIRGIIPLSLLVKLETETGLLSRDIFDFVAGTSTGAVITAGIVSGISARKLLSLYVDRSSEIFTKNIFTPLHRLLFGSMYSITKLNRIVREELGIASEWKLNNVPNDILITSKRLSDGMPIYFVKDGLYNACECGSVRLLDATVASAAAPTYFKPWSIGNGFSDNSSQEYIDGGVGVAGNPVYQACVEAFYFTRQYIPQYTRVISLGTGRFITTYKGVRWLGGWLKWLLNELLSSPGEQQSELVSRHFPLADFYRLDPDLFELDSTLKKSIGLDNVNEVDRLLWIGEKFAERINWRTILDGTDTEFKVLGQKPRWPEYKGSREAVSHWEGRVEEDI